MVEVVWLSRTALRHGLKVNFEVIRGAVVEGRMLSVGFVVGDVIADFTPCFFWVREMAAVEQFGFKAAPKRLGVGRIR